MIRATSGLSRRTNHMDWQIGNVWSCPAVICGGFRWFPRGALHAIRSAIHMTFAHGPAKKRIGAALEATWGPIRSEFAFDPN